MTLVGGKVVGILLAPSVFISSLQFIDYFETKSRSVLFRQAVRGDHSRQGRMRQIKRFGC